MAYIITKTDGTTLTTVQDGQYDNITTSLSLIGKNLFNYGQLQNENFVRLLENFANNTAPVNQLRGQVWFDTLTNSLKVYSGTAWNSLASVTLSTTSVGAGTFWYDTANGQLSINTGSSFSLIGPEGIPGYGKTRLVSTTLIDDTELVHPVILCYIDDEVISIISNASFIINTSNEVDGFSSVVKGITLKNVDSRETMLDGGSTYALAADSLLSEDSSTYILPSTTASASTLVQRDESGNITAAGIDVSSIVATSSGTVSGLWYFNNDILPDRDEGVNLGSQTLKWNNIYASNINSTDDLNASVINFGTLVDPTLSSVNRFDTDVNLTANADNRIATQRATKTYVDTKIAAIPSGGSGGTGYTGSQGIIGYVGSAGTGGGAEIAPPMLYHVTSGYTDGGRVVIKNTAPTAADFPGTTLNVGDIWFDPSAGTGYTQLASQNGWTKLPNGVLIQWGRASPGTNLGEGLRGPFNFNTSFNGTPWTVVATPYLTNSQGGADVWLQVINSSITSSQFYVQYQRATSPSYGLDGFTWIAIGPG